MPSSSRSVAVFTLVAQLICAFEPSQASAARRWARSRRPCNQSVCCSPVVCEPCILPCICIVRPYFYLPYTVLHYANQHPSCNAADCPNITPVTYATTPAVLVSESCTQGNCSNGMRARVPKPVDRPFLDIPEYPYDLMSDVYDPTNPTNDSYFNPKPGDRPIHCSTGIVTTPRGNNLTVQVFLIEIEVPGTSPSKSLLAFGVEIKKSPNGPEPPIEFRAMASPYDSHKYLYEFTNGSVRYLVLGSKE